MLKAFKQINTQSMELNRVQDHVEQVLNPLVKIQILDGNLISNTLIGTDDTQFSHKLDRMPLGWFVADKLAEGDIWRVSWDSKTVTLKASASTTASIWIF